MLTEVVLLGDAGAGKSTVAREYEYRLAHSLAEPQPETYGLVAAQSQEPRLPVVLNAADVANRLGQWDGQPESQQLLTADNLRAVADVLNQDPDVLTTGSCAIVIDGLNELPSNDRDRVANWLVVQRQLFPLAPVVVCHRQYSYPRGLLPFPVVTLDKVDPDQARRYIKDYLRVAEQFDEQLLRQFIAGQKAKLQDLHAGQYGHVRAAQALAEHGRGAARAALWEIVSDAAAPDTARVAVLQSLGAMLGQVRFEAVGNKLRQEMEDQLPRVFDPPSHVTVQQAAIDMISRKYGAGLIAYLLDLVLSDQWQLSRAAWNALAKLGVRPLPKHLAAYRANCVRRLEACEKELYQELILDRVHTLNNERLEILRGLAVPENLPVLLRNRFFVKIQEDVAELVNDVSRMPGIPPEEAAAAWEVLKAQVQDPAVMVAQWLELLQGPCALTAAAAAHRLVSCGHGLRDRDLRSLLSTDGAADRLSAAAALAIASEDKSLAEPLDSIINTLAKADSSIQTVEAISNLANALVALDEAHGKRVIVTVDMNLWMEERQNGISIDGYPWWLVTTSFSVYDDQELTNLLISGDQTEARLAVFSLSHNGPMFGAFTPSELAPEAVQRYCELAEAEHDPKWQRMFARRDLLQPAQSRLSL